MNRRVTTLSNERDRAIVLVGGPADGATITVGPEVGRVAIVVNPSGKGWRPDDDGTPPPSTGIRYHYGPSRKLDRRGSLEWPLVEAQRIGRSRP